MRFLTLVLFLTACGAEDKTAGTVSQPAIQDSTGSEFIADAASLPVCDSASEGKLVYVKADKDFETCDGTAWSVVEVQNGTDGKDGAPGKDGKDGIAGKDGAGVPGVGSYWTDPNAGTVYDDPSAPTTWYLASRDAPISPDLCPTGFTLPAQGEVLPGKFKLYFATFMSTLSVLTRYWTIGNQTVGIGTETTDPSGSTTGFTPQDAVSGSSHLYICHN